MTAFPARTGSDPVLNLPVVGYRSWRLGWNGELRSFGRGAITWVPGQNTASCAHGFAHHAPDPGCDCGLYGRHVAADDREADDEIRGAIVAWGQLQVHADGFRAEHAQVIALVQRGGADRRRRAAEREAARGYGVALVPPSQLEAVAREHGDPVDPQIVRRAHKQCATATEDRSARTRRQIVIDRAYDAVARRVASMPGLRTVLLCIYAYGVQTTAFLWALKVVQLVHAHPHPASITISPLLSVGRAGLSSSRAAVVLNLLPWMAAGLPLLLTAVIWRARRLAHRRARDLPLLAKLRLPIALGIALALPWLPGGWPAVIAATWLIGLAGGTLVAAAGVYAIEHGHAGLAAVMLPGLGIAVALAYSGAPARAIVAAVWLAAHSAVVYSNRRLRISV